MAIIRTIKELIDYDQFCGIVPEPEPPANPDNYLKNVKGGIDAWSEEIDSKVPKY